MMEYILDLFETVWKEERVPDEWRDALLVPIPKKGDLMICGNWRGISLLDVMGSCLRRSSKEGCRWWWRIPCLTLSVGLDVVKDA